MIEQDTGRDGDVQRFCAWPHGDGDSVGRNARPKQNSGRATRCPAQARCFAVAGSDSAARQPASCTAEATSSKPWTACGALSYGISSSKAQHGYAQAKCPSRRASTRRERGSGLRGPVSTAVDAEDVGHANDGAEVFRIVDVRADDERARVGRFGQEGLQVGPGLSPPRGEHAQVKVVTHEVRRSPREARHRGEFRVVRGCSSRDNARSVTRTESVSKRLSSSRLVSFSLSRTKRSRSRVAFVRLTSR